MLEKDAFFRKFKVEKEFEDSDLEWSVLENIYDDYISSEYNWPHPVYVFYSVAGSWVINMGFVLPFILAVLINYIFRKSYRHERKVPVSLIITTIIVSTYYAKGIFFPDYQSESGNMMILSLIFAYLCLKKCGRTITVINRNLPK